MRRMLDIRIVRWELKLAYVVGAILVGFAFASMLRALGAPEPAVVLVSSCVDVATILLGARIFRGKGEPIDPPRAWWRMTARPTLSRRLGILFVVVSAWMAAYLLLAAIGLPGVRVTTHVEDVVVAFVAVVQSGGIAALYLNSAVRLKRLGVPAKEPKFRPTIRLKS